MLFFSIKYHFYASSDVPRPFQELQESPKMCCGNFRTIPEVPDLAELSEENNRSEMIIQKCRRNLQL